MPDPGTALVGAGVIGGNKAAKATTRASNNAADAQLTAAREAEALNRERYADAQNLLNPYIESSGTARDQLMIEMGLAPGEGGTAYMNTPGYQTMQDQSQEAVMSSMPGSTYSGRRIQQGLDQGAGVQQSFYNNYMNMLGNMANPTSATNLANMGMNQGVSIGNQNLQSTNIAGNHGVNAAANNQAFVGDLIGGGANIYAGHLASQGTTPTVAPTSGMQYPWLD